MQQESISVSSTDQVTEPAQPLVQHTRILNGLMHYAQALSTKVLWRYRNDDKVGCDQSVPTALVKIRWTIKQNDVEATRRLEFFQKCTQDVLLHAKILRARLVVVIQALVGSDDGQTRDTCWDDQGLGRWRQSVWVEHHRQSFFFRKILDEIASKEAIAERALGISINYLRSQPDTCKVSGEMKTAGAFSRSAFAV